MPLPLPPFSSLAGLLFSFLPSLSLLSAPQPGLPAAKSPGALQPPPKLCLATKGPWLRCIHPTPLFKLLLLPALSPHTPFPNASVQAEPGPRPLPFPSQLHHLFLNLLVLCLTFVFPFPSTSCPFLPQLRRATPHLKGFWTKDLRKCHIALLLHWGYCSGLKQGDKLRPVMQTGDCRQLAHELSQA